MLARLSRLFQRSATAPICVGATECHRWRAGEGAPIIVDVRGPDEFDGPLGHIEGARNLPLAELSSHVPEIGQETGPVIVVCLTDKRSSQAAAALAGAGIRNIAVLRGGMRAWRG